MKKIILALSVLATLGTANAQWHHHGYYGGYRHGGYGGGWVAPLVIGGVVGAVIARESQPVVVQQQPVIVQNPPIVYQPREYCTAWVETQQADGTITRTRTCSQ